MRATYLTPRLSAALLLPLLACAPFAVVALVGVRPAALWIGLGFAAGIGTAAALSGLLHRRLAEPLEAIATRAIDLAQGKFGVQAESSSPELAGLVQTFNYMSTQLFAYGEETRRLYESLEDGYLETIVALANSLDSKDAYTRGHSQRVGDLAAEIGAEMKLPERDIKLLRYGGILHDIGKIGIVEAILHKQSRLTPEEMQVMREHPMIGDSIVGHVRFLAPVRAAVRHHHEWFDGTGYPDRLVGEKIPLIARVVACSDTYDACTSTRPYQAAMPAARALEICESLAGTHLDPAVVQALKRVIARRSQPTATATQLAS